MSMSKGKRASGTRGYAPGRGKNPGVSALDPKSVAMLKSMVRASKSGASRAMTAAGVRRPRKNPAEKTAAIVRRITRTMADVAAEKRSAVEGMDAKVLAIQAEMAKAKRRKSSGRQTSSRRRGARPGGRP